MYDYNLTDANADELIKICCEIHGQAIQREGLVEHGELHQLWKRLSDTLTDMGLLEDDEEPEEEAEEEQEEEGYPDWLEDQWKDKAAGIW